MTNQGSWLIDRPLTGFALPQGRLAPLLGWFMARRTLVEQLDVLDALGLRAGERVLEVGCGPGKLLELMLDKGVTAVGVDPSGPMRDMAGRRLRRGVEAGRVTLRAGTADRTGANDGEFDAVVSVNNVPMWASLETGFAELHRVLRPGGRLLVAWHGGREPTRIARRRLLLPDDLLDRITAALRATFGNGERRLLRRVVTWEATRSEAG